MNHELKEFLSSHEKPETKLSQRVLADMTLRLKSKELYLKFSYGMILGMLLSLVLCPQFGIGLLENHGIAHIFRIISPMACAAFCALFLLISGLSGAKVFLKSHELIWVLKNINLSLILLPAGLWAGLMIVNRVYKLNHESYGYHAVWILGFYAMIVMIKSWAKKKEILIEA